MLKRIKAAIGTLAVAALLSLGAGTTSAMADHGSHGQWQRSDSQHRQGNRGPRYAGNQNGWRQSQRHGNRHHAHNRGRHGNRHHQYGHNQRGHRNHGYRNHGYRHHRRHNRHYRHYGYHANGRDLAGAIIGGVVIYHLGKQLFRHH